jgi:hypothetical protein
MLSSTRPMSRTAQPKPQTSRGHRRLGMVGGLAAATLLLAALVPAWRDRSAGRRLELSRPMVPAAEQQLRDPDRDRCQAAPLDQHAFSGSCPRWRGSNIACGVLPGQWSDGPAARLVKDEARHPIRPHMPLRHRPQVRSSAWHGARF